MAGATTEKGKFIMPLKEKLSYDDSVNVCDSKGFTICLDVKMSYIHSKRKVLLKLKKLILSFLHW